ncbi:S4 domain-containing protein [Leeuwenhoekiella aequorea]|jgi:ribosome-associated heat shock protein Hsp15|uniref:Heat shock protein Hsp15 n=1 Tax=Leeuwenhoekiella aequorea TaxID=283736 RepID=A0A4Q0P3Y7_9FLAO|nr:S4 domain-containing protein [Leeuwenhoekiella aequorea]AOE08080.1 ribosome-associated heat shock protein implicated in the recycling of the 50S subunit (S4 paralog) [uncultured bacterium]RXG21045.1 heat shock protein Hsp15 [Leeuwenhoekiella aequorea]|tara:strand:+ start:820 stop:1209 length:390 start_codon:yes stop_codon:yes gene_type:complete
MRVDKYLWCVRYFKSRSIATNACKKGQVKMNDVSVKPSREVFPSDTIQVRKNQVDYILEVIEHPPSRVGAKLVGLYVIDKTPAENLEKLDLLNYSKDYYRKKGTGRPTKKDRRDLDDFHDTDDFFEDVE